MWGDWQAIWLWNDYYDSNYRNKNYEILNSKSMVFENQTITNEFLIYDFESQKWWKRAACSNQHLKISHLKRFVIGFPKF